MNDSPRIKSITVKGLFNQFDHHIDFNQQERITVLHGINGVGKTTLLRMLNNLLNFRIYNLNEIPFTHFIVELSNSEKIEIKRISYATDNIIYVYINDKKTDYKNVDIKHLIRRFPWISKSTDSMFYDNKAEELLSLDDVLERYDDRFPKNESIKNSDIFAKLSHIPIQFIEASRLLCTESKNNQHRSKNITPHTVKIYAFELQKHIESVMAEYGKKTQELEQTFPFRLLEVSERYSDEELKRHIEALQDKRQELRNVGLLPEINLAPMDTQSIDTLEARHAEVMNLYVRDSEEKLKVLEPLSKKIKLLLKIINSKFQGKKLHVDENKGLIIVGKDGEIDLPLLSSGEQHELVMFYDLIFKVEPNTLIMIDEPELSLHITWQNKFINELKEIVEQEKFDVLIATHSATIVGNNSHLMVGLGVKE